MARAKPRGARNAIRRAAAATVLAAVLLALALMAWASVRARPEDLPWTPLDLQRPIGRATGEKLAALADDPPRCRALLARAGVRLVAIKPVREGACGFPDGIRFTGGTSPPLEPAGVATACPVAAALAVWSWDVVQPAAQARLHARIVRIEHLGSYNCRRMYGRAEGAWSEHAHANAIDIAGFRLSNGGRVSVARDWTGRGSKAAFLHDVRAGACRLFATTLSPDYNAAHHDHLHLDEAARGRWRWCACR